MKGYSFNHYPRDVEQDESRFVAAQEIIERIKSILSDSKTTSGAYLITGFVSTGMTSFANYAVRELRVNRDCNIRDLLQVFLASIFFSLFNIPINYQNHEQLGSRLFLLILLPFFLLLASIKVIIDHNHKNHIVESYLQHCTLTLKRETKHLAPRSRLAYLSRLYILTSIVHIWAFTHMAFFYGNLGPDAGIHLVVPYSYRFQIYCISFLYLVLFTFVLQSLASGIVYNVQDAVPTDNAGELSKGIAVFIRRKLPAKLVFGIYVSLHLIVPMLLYVIGALFEPFDYFWWIARDYHRYLFDELSYLQGWYLVLLWLFTLIVGCLVTSYTGSEPIVGPEKQVGVDAHSTGFHIENDRSVKILGLSRHKLFRVLLAMSLIGIFIEFLFRSISTYPYYCAIVLASVIFLFGGGVEKITGLATRFSLGFYLPVEIRQKHGHASEREVLRHIVRTLVSSYETILKPFSSFRRSLWRVFLTTILYGCCLVLFYYPPCYEICNDVREQFSVASYFPSQQIFGLPIPYTYEYDFQLRSQIELFARVDSLDFTLDHYRQLMLSGDRTITDPELQYRSKSKFQVVTTSIDYFIFLVYFQFLDFLSDIVPLVTKSSGASGAISNFLANKLETHHHLHLIPPRIDFFFLFLVFCVFWAYSLVSRFGVFGLISNRMVLDRLRRLNSQIDVELYVAEGLSVSHQVMPASLSRQLKSRDCNERYIKDELIAILNLCEQIPAVTMRPRFVFFFDELDRVDKIPLYNERQSKDKLRQDSKAIPFYQGIERNKNFLEILDDLKSFLNVAKAKFIFIVDREKYEVAMKDVEDPESFMGSIFHEVISITDFNRESYVERFDEISSIAESYVCSFLPFDRESFQNHSGSEKFGPYRRHLKDFDYFLQQFYKDNGDKEEKAEQRFKLILAVSNFISYLTYRSNGSKKKIAKHFEEHIVSLSNEELNEKEQKFNDAIVIGDTGGLYLHFSYRDQYIWEQLGFVS